MSFHLNAHNLRFPSQTENLGLWCICNSGEIMGRLKFPILLPHPNLLENLVL